jgi:hypothetical protein
MKTSELTGVALDWAVEVALLSDRIKNVDQRAAIASRNRRVSEVGYTTDWSQGGPIIDREGIDLYCNVATNPSHPDKPWQGSWRARYCRMGYGTEFAYGPTPLVTAMRCYVQSKLGDEVEIPEELR